MAHTGPGPDDGATRLSEPLTHQIRHGARLAVPRPALPTHTMHYDIVIVGGGAGGLELAASLGETQTPRNTSFAGKAKRFWADILGGDADNPKETA